MRMPIEATADIEEKLSNSRFCAEEGLPKNGRWRKAYLSTDMDSIYSTCWAGELEVSDDYRLGKRYEGTKKRSSSGIWCYDAGRGLEEVFPDAYHIDLTGEGTTYWSPVWEVLVDRRQKEKDFGWQWIQPEESLVVVALILEGRN